MLRNALLELIGEKGYESVTIQEITDRADLSRATFYLHYKDKDALLVSALEAMYEDLFKAFSIQEGVATQPNQVSLNAFKHVQEHRELYRILLGERGMATVWQRIQDSIFTYTHQVLKSLQKDLGVSETRIPLEVLARFSSGALNALLIWWVQSNFAYTPEEMSSMYQSMIQPTILANLNHPKMKTPTD